MMKAYRERMLKNQDSEESFSYRRIDDIAVDHIFIHHHVSGDSGRRFQYAISENSFFEKPLRTY